MSMLVRANWRDGVSFTVENADGQSLVTDGPSAHGGKGAGMRPMELLLASAASCSSFDVIHILRKAKHEFSAIGVEVSGERSDAVPAVFTTIALKFKISGVPQVAAERAVKLSVEKYCSVLTMLQHSVKITWSLEHEA